MSKIKCFRSFNVKIKIWFFNFSELNTMKDVDRAMIALSKCRPEEDTEHVRLLLRITFESRRSEILSGEGMKIHDVVKIFPHLEFFPLVMLILCLIF